MVIHDDDTSDPNPPDIRPYGRINTHPNVRASRAVNLPAPRRAAATISTAFGVAVTARIQVVLAVLVFAFLPLAAGHPTVATDHVGTHTYPFSRRGADASLAFDGTDAEAEWYREPTSSAHPTPVLSFLKWGVEGVFAALHSAAEALGSVAPQQATHTHTLAKRHLDGQHIVMVCMIPVLVALSGMFAGLTLGYFSVDPTQLHVLSISGTSKQQEYARRILPVRKDSHLLLTTLILGNMIVNEALPVIADGVLGGGILAVVISTALVVIFAEIIPQSVCSRHGLAIGATMAPVVRVLTWIFFPLAWPIAKLLEYILGAHHGIIYRRSELRELIKMHAAGGGGGGDLDVDTVTIAQGALDLSQKTVMDAMTPMDDVFMLPITAKLDYETLGRVVQSGHSRIPVYQMVEVPDINLQAPAGTGPMKTKIVKKVLGSMLVKSCVLLDPEDATPLASMPINSIPSVPFDEPLTKMLNAFQEGRSHMAIVSRRGKIDDLEDAASVMTAAAGSLRQRIMRKVGISKSSSSGSDTDSDDTDVELGKKHKRFWHKSTTAKSVSAGSTESLESPVEPNPTATNNETRKKAQNEKKPPSRGFSLESAKLTQNEQAVPSDAQLPRANFEQFFEGLEGAPLGIITLEDVLEELIGEEIYDEYDEHDGQRPRVAALSRVIPRKTGSGPNPATAVASPPEHGVTPSADIPSPVEGHHDIPKRVKLPVMPRFSLGRRPASQPGRPRVPIESLSAPAPTAPSPSPARAEKEIDTEGTDRQTRADTQDGLPPPARSPSAPAPAARPRPPAVSDGSLSPRPTRPTALDTATMDRSLRRLAAEGSAAATGLARPPFVRGASQGSIPPTQTPLQAGQAGRRTPKFKSAPINKDVRDTESGNAALVNVAGGGVIAPTGEGKNDTNLNDIDNEKV